MQPEGASVAITRNTYAQKIDRLTENGGSINLGQALGPLLRQCEQWGHNEGVIYIHEDPYPALQAVRPEQAGVGRTLSETGVD